MGQVLPVETASEENSLVRTVVEHLQEGVKGAGSRSRSRSRSRSQGPGIRS